MTDHTKCKVAEHYRCPDDGTCHHGCIEGCFRVAFCAPLSDYGKTWPDEVKETHGRYVGDDPTAVILSTEGEK